MEALKASYGDASSDSDIDDPTPVNIDCPMPLPPPPLSLLKPPTSNPLGNLSPNLLFLYSLSQFHILVLRTEKHSLKTIQFEKTVISENKNHWLVFILILFSQQPSRGEKDLMGFNDYLNFAYQVFDVLIWEGTLDRLQTGQASRVRSFPHIDGNYALHVYIPGNFGCFLCRLKSGQP